MRKTIVWTLLFITFCFMLPFDALAAKIVVDAGHGGSDPGAVGVNDLKEKNVNLDIAERLKAILQAKGYEVEMTRDHDVYVSLANRVDYSDKASPDAFISIHANMYTDSNVKGSMVLYYDIQYPQDRYPASEAMKALTPQSKSLAESVLQELVKAAGTVNKGLMPSSAYVVRSGTVPSILVETGFLSNWEDAALLADSDAKQRIAQGIANGIEAYQPAESVGFVDLNRHWAKEAILRLWDKGIVQGEGNRFYPNRALTRAEFVAMLERQFPLPVIEDRAPNAGACVKQEDTKSSSVVSSVYGTAGSAACSVAFADLSKEHWAYDALMQAYQHGVVDGYAGGTIRPDQPISRGEAAVLLDRVLWPDDKPGSTTGPFIDVPQSLWSAAAINRLKAKSIIEGASADRYSPEQAITRGEMSAILNRLMN